MARIHSSHQVSCSCLKLLLPHSLLLFFLTDRVVFALAYTGEAVNFQAPSQLYRTTDGGKTWTTLHYSIS